MDPRAFESMSAEETRMNPFQSPIDSISMAGSRRQTCGSAPNQSLHRIARVMEIECVGMRAAAHRMNLPTSQARAESEASYDLRLSDLYRWQSALKVPVGELLNEPATGLSPAVAWRGRLLKVMRTLRSIQALADDEAIQSLAMLVVQQLEEMMPELNQVTAWPLQGRRRTGDEYGAVVEKQLSDDFFDGHPDR
jgi:hypothetical protein